MVEGTGEAGDLGIVNDDVQDFGSDSFSPAPGIETVCVFPKNPSKGKFFCIFILSLLFCLNDCSSLRIASLRSHFSVFAVVAAGEESELLVGMKNDGNPLCFSVFLLPFKCLILVIHFPILGAYYRGFKFEYHCNPSQRSPSFWSPLFGSKSVCTGNCLDLFFGRNQATLCFFLEICGILCRLCWKEKLLISNLFSCYFGSLSWNLHIFIFT